MAQAVIGPVSRWHDSGIVGVGPGLWYGPTALDGAAGDWKRAPLGSIYVQVDAAGGISKTWQKTARAGTTADWSQMTTSGIAGGQTISGGTAANDDLILQGTSHATKTTSYVLLQPTGGKVGVGAHVSAINAAFSVTGPDAGTGIAFQILDSAGIAKFTVDDYGQTSDSPYVNWGGSGCDVTAAAGKLSIAGHLAVTGGIRPKADGIAALTLCKANGTAIVTVDTTSSLTGINTAPTTALHVAANESLAGNTTDDYSAALTLDPAYTGDGIVTTVTLNAGGTGYTANDVITVVQTGGAGCTVTVNTVDGSGVITGITLLAGGTGYEVANALATTGGTGSGGKINITVLTARTVTRHNYIDVNQLALTKGAAVTGAALLRFDANVGTHKALLTGTTKTTPTGVDAWIPINANGTIMYIAVYASTTA